MARCAAPSQSWPRRLDVAACALVLVFLGWPGATLALEAALVGTPPAVARGFLVDADNAVLALTAEGRSLIVEIVDGEIAATAELRLGPEHVFEDRRARIVDTDGDGADEILVVRSDLARGAALALYEASGGTIQLRAVSRPIGRPHRWLNPVGVADFNGDGRREIAAVLTPHLAGRLTLYRQDGAVLIPLLAGDGYSNHVIGSRELGMAAVADVDGHGAAEAIVPARGYREVVVVSFADGRLDELGRVRHDARVVTNLVVGLVSGVRGAVYGLSDGTVAVVTLPLRD